MTACNKELIRFDIDRYELGASIPSSANFDDNSTPYHHSTRVADNDEDCPIPSFLNDPMFLDAAATYGKNFKNSTRSTPRPRKKRYTGNNTNSNTKKTGVI